MLTLGIHGKELAQDATHQDLGLVVPADLGTRFQKLTGSIVVDIGSDLTCLTKTIFANHKDWLDCRLMRDLNLGAGLSGPAELPVRGIELLFPVCRALDTHLRHLRFDGLAPDHRLVLRGFGGCR